MSQLPARPDLDQLRRQARELYRAALGGDAGALRRLRQVSGTVALSAAQLAIARAYGFASWPQLKAEVEDRRARAANPADEAAEEAGADQAVLGAGQPSRRRSPGNRCGTGRHTCCAPAPARMSAPGTAVSPRPACPTSRRSGRGWTARV